MKLADWLKAKLQEAHDWCINQQHLLADEDGDEPWLSIQLSIKEEEVALESEVKLVPPSVPLTISETVEKHLDKLTAHSVIIVPREFYDKCDKIVKDKLDLFEDKKQVIYFEEGYLCNVALLSTGYGSYGFGYGH